MNWKKRVCRWLLGAALVLVIPLGLLSACQSRLIYFPRPYPAGHAEAWARQAPGKLVDFQTSQGSQRAFLQGNLTNPRNFWVVCAGNATLALEWSEWISTHGPPEDAWLLVDFPGYGDSAGNPNPRRIHESLKNAIPAGCAEVGLSPEQDAARLRFFGHSLGGAACLIAATEFGIQQGVLLSPFTSTMDMGRTVTGLPIGFLVRHRFDNVARLTELLERGPGRVIILHGAQDEIIPVEMARQLARLQPETISLREIPGGRHNTLHLEDPEAIAKALRDVASDLR